MREEIVAHRVEQSVQEEIRACKSRAEHTEKGTHTSVSAAGARRHARSAAEPRGQRERERERAYAGVALKRREACYDAARAIDEAAGRLEILKQHHARPHLEHQRGGHEQVLKPPPARARTLHTGGGSVSDGAGGVVGGVGGGMRAAAARVGCDGRVAGARNAATLSCARHVRVRAWLLTLSTCFIVPSSVACHWRVLPGSAISMSRLWSSDETLCGKSFVGSTVRAGGDATACRSSAREKAESFALRTS